LKGKTTRIRGIISRDPVFHSVEEKLALEVPVDIHLMFDDYTPPQVKGN
jgi:hypothetical protein